MTFEEWWNTTQGKEQHYGKSVAIDAYQAGRDAMREEAVKVCVAAAGRFDDDYAAGAEDSAKAIKELK